MTAPDQPEESVLEAALPLPPDLRPAYLDQACGQDIGLRQRVELLLRVHDRSSDFMTKPAVPTSARTPLPIPLQEGAGDTIGRYKLLQQIGEGGCGVVYMAEQQEPVRRRVALKVIKLGMDTKSVIARFEAERQALAMMDHPNIAKVLDAGATDTGRPYFVMELVRGIKITEFCDANKLGTEERLGLLIQVCRAVQHAHQKGIIHRDIKPSNILVSIDDGMPVPKVIDFGIAKATHQQPLTDKTLFTAFEQFLGTPAYVSPEQALMTNLDIDTRADIYSLGVLLYELLTGRTPFETQELLEAGLDTMRRTIGEKEPLPPSARLSHLARETLTTTAASRHTVPPHLIHLVRGDLDWIAMKCLEKDRSRRYETANELAADLKRHLNQEPVLAAAPSALYRFGKLVRRNKGVFATVGAVALMLVLGVAVSTWQAARARRAEREQGVLRTAAEEARQNETQLRQQAEAASVDARATLSSSDFLQGLRLIEEDKPNDALPFLARSVSVNPANNAALTRLATLLTYHSWMLPTPVLKHGGPVNSAEFSPDGKRIVTASADGTARVWDAQTYQPLVEPMKYSFGLTSAQFSPDGKRIVTISADLTVRVWDAQTGQPVTEPMKHERPVASVHFSPDGKRIVIGSCDNTARVWDAQTGQPLTESLVHGYVLKEPVEAPRNATGIVYSINEVGNVYSVDGSETLHLSFPSYSKGNAMTAQFSPDGKRIVTASEDGTTRVWDAQTGQALTEPMKLGNGVASAQFSADGKRIVTISHDHTAREWDAQTGEQLADPEVHSRPPGSKQFSPDGRRLVSISPGGIARVWDARTGQPLTVPMRHQGNVSTAQFSPDGERILTTSGEDVAYLWDAQTGPPSPFFHAPKAPWTRPQFSHDGRRIVMPSPDKTALVWDAQTGRLLTRMLQDSQVVWTEFSPDDKRIVTASKDGTVRIWDAQTGQPLTEPMKHSGQVNTAQFSPDGKRIVTASWDGTARVWDAQTGQPLAEPMKHGDWVNAAEFSPDGKRIVTTSRDGTARVWDVQTGQPLAEPMKHDGAVNTAEFSPDGRRIVTASRDGTARVWDAQTGQSLAEPMKHDRVVSSAQFSPDGERIVTASEDGTARVWDAQTGQPLTEPMKHSRLVYSAQFSPDGKRIVTASLDATARVWDAQTGQPLAEPMTHGYPVYSAQFSPDGMRMLTGAATYGTKARVWDVAPTQMPYPDWLIELAEAISGKVLSKEGVLEPTRLNRVETVNRIRQNLASQPDDDWVLWGRWLLADRATRTLSPFSQITISELVNRQIQKNTLASLREAIQRSPSNSVAYARLALLLEKRDPKEDPAHLEKAEFHARFALKLDPDNGVAWHALGAIQAQEGRLAEALQAIGRALELQPGDALAWEVRGGILEKTNQFTDALAAYSRQVELVIADTNKMTSEGKSALLNRVRVLKQLGRWEEAAQDMGRAYGIPRREARDLPTLIDLSAFYNAGFKGNWHRDQTDNDLSELPVGVQILAGHQFDVRGLIQLRGTGPNSFFFPEQALGLPVHLDCRRVHFLHGAVNAFAPHGTEVGKYVFHYEDGTARERPIVLGEDVLDWWVKPLESAANDSLTVAWSGQNGKSRSQNLTIQLYKTTWENPSPQVQIVSIDFISAKKAAAPFLIAITVE